MRTLGIDYGDARVGIAISDALGITAQGLETISYNGNDKILLRRLDEIITEYNVSKIIVYLKKNGVYYFKDLFLLSLDLFLLPVDEFITRFEELKKILGDNFVDELGENYSLIEKILGNALI